MSSFVLNRYWSNEQATLGLLYACDNAGIRVIAYTLEDPHQVHKIPGRTRIPEGQYNLKRRTHGSWAKRFQQMNYPGSIEIYPVPDFTDVLAHWGNDAGDTAGCILMGIGIHFCYGDDEKPFLFNSRDGCQNFYDIFYSKPDSYSWILYINNHEHRAQF